MSASETPRVKLCGLRRPQDVEAANEARPDYVGFVVDFPRSRRSVSASELATLSRLVHPEIRRVGVFVDKPVEAIAELSSFFLVLLPLTLVPLTVGLIDSLEVLQKVLVPALILGVLGTILTSLAAGGAAEWAVRRRERRGK